MSPGRAVVVCIRLFSAEFSVNRWVWRAEYVWVRARVGVPGLTTKKDEAARG